MQIRVSLGNSSAKLKSLILSKINKNYITKNKNDNRI